MSGELQKAILSEAEMLQVLRSMIGRRDAGKLSAADLGRELGVTQAYISIILNGKTTISDRIANVAGYRRRVVFERIEGGEA